MDDVDEVGVAGVQSGDGVRPLEVRLGRVQPGDAARRQGPVALKVVADVTAREMYLKYGRILKHEWWLPDLSLSGLSKIKISLK